MCTTYIINCTWQVAKREAILLQMSESKMQCSYEIDAYAGLVDVPKTKFSTSVWFR